MDDRPLWKDALCLICFLCLFVVGPYLYFSVSHHHDTSCPNGAYCEQ